MVTNPSMVAPLSSIAKTIDENPSFKALPFIIFSKEANAR